MDQTSDGMIQLISRSREHFVKRRIRLKLFRRFWRSLGTNSRGLTYTHVLKIFFSESLNASIQSHRKNFQCQVRYKLVGCLCLTIIIITCS